MEPASRWFAGAESDTDRIEALRVHLVLVAPGWLPTGLEFTDEEWLAVLRARADEPWYTEAYAAMMRLEAGELTAANRIAATPFHFFRWTAAARRFAETEQAQISPEAQAGSRVRRTRSSQPASQLVFNFLPVRFCGPEFGGETLPYKSHTHFATCRTNLGQPT